MEEKHINKKITFSIVAVLLIVLVTIGATYAYFSAQAQTDVQTVTTGTLTMGFTNGDIVNATGITPINDNEIKTKATSLPFSVTNTGNQHTKITIELTDITIDDALKDVDFRWGLYNADTDKGVSFGILKNAETGGKELLLRDVILDKGSATKNYKLRIWIHDDGALQNEMQGKTFSGKVVVTGEAVEYTPETCFTFNNGSITGYDAETCGKDVVIPKTINGTAVTTIGGYIFNTGPTGDGTGASIDTIVIPDTVTKIDTSAMDYQNLSFWIPDSVVSIGYLTGSIINNIPESVTSFIGNGQYSSYDTVVVPGSMDYIQDWASPADVLILMEGFKGFNGTSINGNWESIEIPSSVTTIGNYTFDSVHQLKEIIVRGKSSLSDFADSTGLTTAGGLPEGVNIIFRP